MRDDIPVSRYLPDWLLPLYGTVTPEEEAAAALLACVEMIRTGTTTFCEAGTLFDVAAVADAVEQVGMRAILGRWTWDLESQAGRMRQTTDEALALTEDVLGKVHGRGGGRISAWPLLLGFGTCSDALIRGAHALATRHGVGWGMMQAALHPSRPSRDTLPLARLDALGVLDAKTKLAHMVYVDDADIALLARRGVKIAHCPTAGLKHTKGLAAHGRFPEMVDAGVCVSLGGDSGNGSNHFDMLRLMYLAATVYKDARNDVGVLPAERVLEMGTIRGAEALLLDRQVGSVEPGKRADLVLYDLDTPEWRPLLNPVNNLVYAASGASVRTVLIDGRVVLDEGRLTTLDECGLYERVERLSREHVRRAGVPIESAWPVVP
jgi:cytosine/adenosine deaminase-related metal-dependent hydrolase